jgi:hypothetical protein
MDCSYSDASSGCASEDEQDCSAGADPMQCDAPALTWRWSDVKHIQGVPTPEVVPLAQYSASCSSSSSSSSSGSSQQLHLEPSAAQQLRAMQAPVTAAHLSYMLMNNVDGRARTRSSIRSKVCLRRQLLVDAAAVASHLHSEFDKQRDDSPGDDDDWLCDAECDEAEAQSYADDVERLEAAFEHQQLLSAADEGNHLRHGALGHIPLSQMLHFGPSQPGTVVAGTADLAKQLNKAVRTSLGMVADLHSPSAEAEEVLSRQLLALRPRPRPGTTEAVLCVVQADPADPSQVAWQKLSVVKAGEVPPFVKTPAPPSILETIQVCGLNYKQSLAFALVAHVRQVVCAAVLVLRLIKQFVPDGVDAVEGAGAVRWVVLGAEVHGGAPSV